MEYDISILKGLHPGILLERILKERKLGKGRFAMSVDEFPQTLVAIMKGKRKMNIPLSLKIEKMLGMEEGFFMTLQLFHDIKLAKYNPDYHPDLAKLRRVLFWDTTFEKINWDQYKVAVIRRVFERGTEEEKEEIKRFYGNDVVDEVLKSKS